MIFFGCLLFIYQTESSSFSKHTKNLRITTLSVEHKIFKSWMFKKLKKDGESTACRLYQEAGG